MPRPESKRDLIVMLTGHPGWEALKEEFERKINEQLDLVTTTHLHDQKSVGRHNVSLGKIEAYREVLNFPKSF